MTENWFRTELKARRGLSYAWGESTCPGTRTIEARHESTAAPIGIVWFCHAGNSTIEIQYSFVRESARRCGVRTWLHHKLLEGFPKTRKIITAAGTRFSRPWLVKMGFRKNPRSLDWELEVGGRTESKVQSPKSKARAQRGKGLKGRKGRKGLRR